MSMYYQNLFDTSDAAKNKTIARGEMGALRIELWSIEGSPFQGVSRIPTKERVCYQNTFPLRRIDLRHREISRGISCYSRSVKRPGSMHFLLFLEYVHIRIGTLQISYGVFTFKKNKKGPNIPAASTRWVYPELLFLSLSPAVLQAHSAEYLIARCKYAHVRVR